MFGCWFSCWSDVNRIEVGRRRFDTARFRDIRQGHLLRFEEDQVMFLQSIPRYLARNGLQVPGVGARNGSSHTFWYHWSPKSLAKMCSHGFPMSSAVNFRSWTSVSLVRVCHMSLSFQGWGLDSTCSSWSGPDRSQGLIDLFNKLQRSASFVARMRKIFGETGSN